jgi:hypothetical protein
MTTKHDLFRVIKDYTYYDYAYYAEIQRKREEERAGNAFDFWLLMMLSPLLLLLAVCDGIGWLFRRVR